MALFWFICGILLICCIARYNESDKLFWTLLVSFVGAFTAASVIIAICNNDKHENVNANVSPTQLYVNTTNTNALLATVFYNTTNDVSYDTPVAVSKDYYIGNDVLSDSRVSNLEDKPPQSKQLCYNISIPLKLSKFNPIKDSS